MTQDEWLEETRRQAYTLSMEEGAFHEAQRKSHDLASKLAAISLFPIGCVFGNVTLSNEPNGPAALIGVVLYLLLILSALVIGGRARGRTKRHNHTDPAEFVQRRMMEWEFHS